MNLSTIFTKFSVARFDQARRGCRAKVRRGLFLPCFHTLEIEGRCATIFFEGDPSKGVPNDWVVNIHCEHFECFSIPDQKKGSSKTGGLKRNHLYKINQSFKRS